LSLGVVVIAANRGSNKKMSALSRIQAVVSNAMYGRDPKSAMSNFFDLKDRLIDGTETTMGNYKGHVLCVVNVASK